MFETILNPFQACITGLAEIAWWKKPESKSLVTLSLKVYTPIPYYSAYSPTVYTAHSLLPSTSTYSPSTHSLQASISTFSLYIFLYNPACPSTVYFTPIPCSPAYSLTVYPSFRCNPAYPRTVFKHIPYNPAYPPTVYTTIPYNPADPPTAPVHHVLLPGVYNYSLNNPFLNTQQIPLQSVQCTPIPYNPSYPPMYNMVQWFWQKLEIALLQTVWFGKKFLQTF